MSRHPEIREEKEGLGWGGGQRGRGGKREGMCREGLVLP
jgi:hypothetical protein